MARRRRSVEEERAWQEVRRIVLERDDHTCVDCGQRPPSGELDVHHLIPRAVGGRDEAGNCVLLCDGCHARRHPQLQVSLARRTIERWALALARFLDVRRGLPAETRALDAGLHLFGVDRFREGQLDAVLGALRGESLLVIRPTGSGKSLCFQLPAVLKGQPASFVLSPLKTLMVDQAMGLHERQLPASFINGDIQGREKAARYQLLEQGALTMLYVAPERFGNRVNAQEVARLTAYRPSFLVVDEAHVVDQWGDDFRPQYGRIAEIRAQLGNPPLLAFTATAGLETQQRLLASLGVPDARILLSDVDRPNIALLRLLEADHGERARIIARLLATLEGRAMIFVPTKRIGEEVQGLLAGAGVRLSFYHSRLDKLERDSIQGRFSGQHEPGLNAIITTSAFSMGIDIPDVRLVVHWQHPGSVEDYLQEFGRAGRDGRPALALLFSAGEEDKGIWRWMAERSRDESIEKRRRPIQQAVESYNGRIKRLDQLQQLVSQDRCFRASLNEVLQGPNVRQRRSLSRWLLELVFARRVRITPAGVCCDYCNPELGARVRAGLYAPDGRPFQARRALPSVRLESIVKVGKSLMRALAVLAALCVLYVGASLALAVVDIFTPDGKSGETQAVEIFDRYVTHRTRQPFENTEARPFHGYYIACAKPENNPKALCMLIHPDREPGHRITGFYYRQGSTRTNCLGAAQQLGLCRRR